MNNWARYAKTKHYWPLLRSNYCHLFQDLCPPLAHSLVEDRRPMVVVMDAEADETRKHPFPKCLNSQQYADYMREWTACCFGRTEKDKDIKKREHRWWALDGQQQKCHHGGRELTHPLQLPEHTHIHIHTRRGRFWTHIQQHLFGVNNASFTTGI